VQRYVEPELLWYAWSWLRVRGALCCRRVTSSSLVRHLSSPCASSGRAYRHRGVFGHRVVRSSFVLNRSCFFVTVAVLQWGRTPITWSVSSLHVMGVAEEDRECVALTVVHGNPTSQTDNFVSEAGSGGSDELTRLACSSGTSFRTMAILSPVGSTATVGVDHRSPSIRWRAVSIWSLLHSFVSFVHADLVEICSFTQLNSSSMGAIWRQPSRLQCREHGSGLSEVVKGRDKDCILGEGISSW
jgi:hypothetical protein